MKILENGFIGYEGHHRAVRFLRLGFFMILFQHSFFKLCRFLLAIAKCSDTEVLAEGIDSFGTYAIQAYAFLKCLAIVFGAGVDLANYIDDLA